jgi:riboflavin kinase/FMN adenylyltransferase
VSEAAFGAGQPSGIPNDGRGAVVTVGTFDGVHRGHRAVLDVIRTRASEADRRGVLLTFHPHPLRVIRPEVAPALLTTLDEKKEILAETGLDYAVFLRFTRALSQYSPARFVEEILVDRLGVRELIVGQDHGFGRGRSGDVGTLRDLGRSLGFDVDVVAPVSAGDRVVSSSRIRRAVCEGDLRSARSDLGRPYSLRGVVAQGEGRGADLGFPTANLELPDPNKLLPPEGIYAVRGVLRRGTFDGALHLGPRPTFPGSSSTLEVHLLKFDADIYGEAMRVDLIRFLRPVRAFESGSALVRQMEFDVAEAKTALVEDASLHDRVVTADLTR